MRDPDALTIGIHLRTGWADPAEPGALESAFNKIFDLIGAQHTVRIEGAERSIQAIPTPLEDGGLSFDEIATRLPQSVLQIGGGMTVVANNERVVLEEAPADAFFTIRTTEEEEIESPSDLERLQEELSRAQQEGFEDALEQSGLALVGAKEEAVQSLRALHAERSFAQLRRLGA